MNKKNSKYGFTLVELLAVIVILGIVLALAMPSISSLLTNTKRRAFVQDIKAYSESVRISFLRKEISFPKRENELTIVAVNAANIESYDNQSAFSVEWFAQYSYIVVQNKGTVNRPLFEYYFVGLDHENNGTYLNIVSDLKESDILLNSANKDEIMAIGNQPLIGNSNGYLNIVEAGSLEAFPKATNVLVYTNDEYSVEYGKHLVSFNTNGGLPVFIPHQIIEDGERAVAPNDPTRIGYEFLGWNPSTSTIITKPTTFVAQWLPKSYTVSFNLNGGSGTVPSQTVGHGDKATIPTNPTRVGYVFTGWSPNINNPITGNTTFTAQWQNNNLTISFNLNGGVGSIPNQIVTYGNKATIPTAPTRDGHAFLGWVPNINNTLTQDTTFEAQWVGKTYLVNFNLNGGNGLAPTQMVAHGNKVTIPPVPTRSGYVFTGWNPNINNAIIENTTFVASWSTSAYTVSFNLNGGVGSIPNQNVSGGDKVTIPANPTRPGYAFLGWSPNINNPINGNTTFTAQWVAESYTVTFDLNGGSGTAPTQHVNYGSLVTKPSNPTRVGYTFTGWSPNINNPVTANTTFTAQWTLNTYNVSFNLNGGSGSIPNQSISHGSTATAPSDPTRLGYTFNGWSPNINNAITSNTTFVADWVVGIYTVSFDLNGGSGVAPSQNINHGGIATIPSNPTRTGYTFNGWSPNISNPITGNTIFVAQWTINTYTVTFNLAGGSGTIPNQSVAYGGTATVPSNPTRSGYTFEGWSPNINDSITSNTTFTAQWGLDSYVVSFNLNGGTGSIPEQVVDHGSKATIPTAPTRPGYTFNGWSPNISNNITAPTTFVAQWVVNSYTVTFNLNGGTGTAPTQTVNYGGVATVPSDPTKSGYTFGGWSPAIDSVITGNTTFVAQWDINTYSVNFNLNGGEGEITPQEVGHGSTATVPTNPTRTGYVFAGWSPNINNPITSNTTFVASWTINTYTVTFNLNGGSGTIPTQTVNYGGKATAPSNPTRVGYTFNGWSPVITTTITSNTTFTAQWTINKYTVSFNLNGGTGTIANQTINHGSTATVPTAPTRTGYTFGGWSPNINNAITGNTTFVAQWTINSYTVSFNLNGGSGTIPIQTVNYGGKATAPTNPTRAGYAFTAWSPVITTTITGNTTFVAQWQINTYTVSFNLNGGSGTIANQTINHGSTATVPTAPTRTGYTFAGWSPNINNPITSNTTFVASWTINTYTVTFNLNGGSGTIPTQTVNYGGKATAPTNPTRVGYAFNGWSPVITTTITGNTTFIAQWQINTYTVSFDVNGGTGTIPNQTINHGSKATAPSNPTRVGYTFGGWSPAISTTITGNTTFVAQWTINSYTVTFDLNGGSGVAPNQTVNHGGKATVPTPPTRVGYTFNGWSPVISTIITSNTAFTAQWTLNSYTVSFNVNGGTGTIPNQTINHGSTATVPSTPTRTGYGFSGWSPGINNAITGPTTFVASWAINTYTVSFNLNGGEGSVPSQTINHGGTATAPENPTRTGYTFNGWSPVIASTTITSNTTFVAQWTINTYGVGYNANGGSGAPASQTKTYGVNLTLSSTIPTKTGYTFTGWNTNAAGTGTNYAAGGTYSGNTAITLYAKWVINTYTVSFNLNGGTGTAPNQTVNYGSTATAPSNPTRTGYTFGGWSPVITTTITADRTFTAQWTLNTYTVSFNLNGGTGTAPSQTINHGGTATVPSNPTRTGYTFNGWSPAISTVITGNTTFTAQWTIDTYAVSFNANGGSGAPSAQTKTYGTNLTLSSTAPTRTGYTFAGWNTNAAGTGTNYAAGGSYTANAAVTLYAKWTINTYTLTVNPSSGNLYGSTATKAMSNTYSSYTAVRRPFRTGYTFSSWTQSGSGTLTGLGTHIPARTEAVLANNSYWQDKMAVYNNAGDGTVTVVTTTGTNPYDNSGKFTRITSTGTTSTPGRGGFYYGTTSAASKVYYHVIVAKVPVGVTLQDARNSIGDGGSSTWITSKAGTGQMETYIYRVNAGATGSFSSFGHVYANGGSTNMVWDVYYSHMFDATSATVSNSHMLMFNNTGNKTITANWSINTYAVSFNANGGSGAPGAQTKTYGTNLTLSATKPTRTGHTFAGWNTNTAGTGTNYASGGTYSSNSAVTLYAKWTKHTYSVSFNANGGSGAPAAQTKTYGTSLTLTTAKPTRTGYTFAGWNTNAAGTGTNYASGGAYTANAAVTLYAKWTINKYTVTFNANGGSGAPGAQTKTYGTNLVLSTGKPTRTGYTFNGWNTNSAGTGTNYASGATYTANAAVTLYAKWTINKYTVSFNANGGSGAPAAQTKTYGTNLTLTTAKPTRTYYTFAGWNTNAAGTGTNYASGGTYSTNGGATLYAKWTPTPQTVSKVHSTRKSGTVGTAPYDYQVNVTYTATYSGPTLTTLNVSATMQRMGGSYFYNGYTTDALSPKFTVTVNGTAYSYKWNYDFSNPLSNLRTIRGSTNYTVNANVNSFSYTQWDGNFGTFSGSVTIR